MYSENEILTYLESVGLKSVKLAENLINFIRSGLVVVPTKDGFATFAECDCELLCVGMYTTKNLMKGSI